MTSWIWVLMKEETDEHQAVKRTNVAAFNLEPRKEDLLKVLQSDKHHGCPESLAVELCTRGFASVPGGSLVLDEVPMWEVPEPEEVPVLYKILKDAMEGKQ